MAHVRGIFHPMSLRQFQRTMLLSVLLSFSAAFAFPTTASAQSAVAERSDEQCIVYREQPTGGYRLINECDYAINVSWCSDAAPSGGDCSRNVGWQTARVGTQSDVPGQFVAAQAISLFACRFPKTVEILIGGSARCQSDAPPDTANVLPFLPASSLKNPLSIITASDFPATSRDKQGNTRFEMTVGADGKPLSCSVTTSSGHADLDSAACKAFLKRARFTPAKDEKGVAIPSRYKGSVSWKAP
jgi:TonB family protein